MAKAVFMVVGDDIEGFLSGTEGLKLTHLKRSGRALYGKCAYRDLERVRSLAQNHNLEFKVLMQTYRPIGYFVIAVLVTGLLLGFFWSSRAWTFMYNSNDEALIDEVHAYLWERGVRPGTRTDSFTFDELEDQILQSFPQLNYVSLKKDGIVLKIEMSVRPPQIEETRQENLYAAYGGIVRSTSVLLGESLVKPGDVVYKGQLLVRGNPYAEGSIIGETVVELKKTVDTRRFYREETREKYWNFHIRVGGLVYDFGFKKPELSEFEVWTVTERRLGWAGSRRQFVEVTLTEYIKNRVSFDIITIEEATRLAEAEVEELFETLFSGCKVFDKQIETELGKLEVNAVLRARVELDLTQERLGESIDGTNP